MTVGRLDQREHFEGRGQAVPFGGIPGREPDFQIRDPGPGDRPHMQPPGQCLPDGRRPESGENARVGQVGQRHASERSAIGTRLSASSAWFTSASRSVVASCKARPTVSLMVVVPKWSRAAASTSSSISTSLFVTRKVYTKSKSIYTGRPTPTTSPRKRPADDVSAETPRRRRLRGNAPPTTSPRKRPADDVSAETSSSDAPGRALAARHLRWADAAEPPHPHGRPRPPRRRGQWYRRGAGAVRRRGDPDGAGHLYQRGAGGRPRRGEAGGAGPRRGRGGGRTAQGAGGQLQVAGGYRPGAARLPRLRDDGVAAERRLRRLLAHP